MKKIKWSDISKYREELFGLAIISIMVSHYFENVSQATYVDMTILKIVARIYNGSIGSVGVDIFLFLSGFGIYYSLMKKPFLLDFYYKRTLRVIVPYLVLGGIFWIIRDLIILQESILRFLYDYSLLSFWGEGERAYWYISLICILYLVSPLVYSYGKKGMVIASIISLVFSIGIYFISLEIFYQIEIAILRIPIYFIGMYCAELACDDKEVNIKVFGGGAVVSISLKVITGYMDFLFARLFNTPYAIALIFFYICLRKLMKEENIIKKVLVLIGHYSLELYIVHVGVRAIMGTTGMQLARPLIYGLCIGLSVPIAIGYAQLHKNVLMGRR